MKYYLTTEENGILRMEDDYASVTFRCLENKAQLLSIVVPEEKRRAGLGKSILSAAEAELFRRDVRSVGADFLEEVEGMPEFLKACGYEVRHSLPVVSVDTEMLMKAKAVQKSMLCSFLDCLFVPAQDLQDIQWDELFTLFNKLNIPIEESDREDMAEEFSGVVYNEKMLPRAFVFCSAWEDLLFIDFLGGVSKKEPQSIMVALQGILKPLEDADDFPYSRIAMLMADDLVGQLLRRALDRGTELAEISRTFHAEKHLKNPGEENTEEITEVDHSNPLMRTLIREYSDFPMQKNVGWKFAYVSKFRNRSGIVGNTREHSVDREEVLS